jgi:Zn-dependent protease
MVAYRGITSNYAMTTLLAFIVLILSIIAHEVAHGYAADAQGDPTARLSGRLTLNPLPHIDPMGSIIIPALLMFSGSPILFGWARPVPYNPYNLSNKRWGETFVALAGSATNLLLALVFGLIVRFGAMLPEPALALAATIAFVNLFLGLFNLIPFPPLDGFVALRSALPWHLASRMNRFEAQMRSMGMLSLVLFLLIFSYLLSGPFFSLVVRLFSVITGQGI